VTTLVRLAPERWDTWFRLGELLLVNDDHRRAIEALERAVALAPAELRARVEVRLVEALGVVDVPRALAVGRAAHPRWIAAAERSQAWRDRTWRDEIARGLGRFAELERRHGDPTAAAALRMASIRLADDDQLASRYYNIACFQARQGQPREARDWLRAAILLEPTHPRVTGARADRDLHMRPDLDFDRILDATRDVDPEDK
jgi:tetratricopeptide (TPR) repeat protein